VSRQRLAFVLGKPPRRGTVVEAVLDRLRANGLTVTVHLPHDHGKVSTSELIDADLVVQRGLRASMLSELLAVELAGVRCCNPIAATMAAADRLEAMQQLAESGVAVPPTHAVTDWEEACQAAGSRPLSPMSSGRSEGVVAGECFVGEHGSVDDVGESTLE